MTHINFIKSIGLNPKDKLDTQFVTEQMIGISDISKFQNFVFQNMESITFKNASERFGILCRRYKDQMLIKSYRKFTRTLIKKVEETRNHVEYARRKQMFKKEKVTAGFRNIVHDTTKELVFSKAELIALDKLNIGIVGIIEASREQTLGDKLEALYRRKSMLAGAALPIRNNKIALLESASIKNNWR